MPMHDQHPAAVGGYMNQWIGVGRDAEQRFDQRDFIVITGDETDPDTAPPPRVNFIHDIVLCSAPVPRRSEIPTVNNVADKVELVGAHFGQKRMECVRFASARTK